MDIEEYLPASKATGLRSRPLLPGTRGATHLFFLRLYLITGFEIWELLLNLILNQSGWIMSESKMRGLQGCIPPPKCKIEISKTQGLYWHEDTKGFTWFTYQTSSATEIDCWAVHRNLNKRNNAYVLDYILNPPKRACDFKYIITSWNMIHLYVYTCNYK